MLATKAREAIMAECPQHNVMICEASETVSLDFVPDRITVYEDEQGIARKIEVG
jgi:di/tripeptidase